MATASSSLQLEWIPGFIPKRHSPEFQPLCPSISPLTSTRDSDKLLCPVRAYRIYLDRSWEWLSKFPAEQHPLVLWSVPMTASQASMDFLSELFSDLVKDSRRSIRGVNNLVRGSRRPLRGPKVDIGIHQTRKLAAAYSLQVGHDEVVKSKIGFSELRILRKNYFVPVPALREACVLPGGTFIPDRTHEFSDSDSD